MKTRIGLFFGSFNPIHYGHLQIAETMKELGGLDNVWFIVSPKNPLKQESILIDGNHRLNMVNIAIEKHLGLFASDVEFSLKKPSYTIDTLDFLINKWGNREFVLIMGQDNLEILDKWKDYQRILDNYTIYVYPRTGCKECKFLENKNITLFDFKTLDISSSIIRQKIRNKENISDLTDPDVEKYIYQHGLYQ